MFYDNGIIWFLHHVKYIHTYIHNYDNCSHLSSSFSFATHFLYSNLYNLYPDSLTRHFVQDTDCTSGGSIGWSMGWSMGWKSSLSCAIDSYKLRPSAGVFCGYFVSLLWFFCSNDTSFPEVSGVNDLLVMRSCSCSSVLPSAMYVIQVVPNMHVGSFSSVQQLSNNQPSNCVLFLCCTLTVHNALLSWQQKNRARLWEVFFNDHIMHKIATLLINNLDENAYISLFRSFLVMCWNMVTWWYSDVILMWFSDEITM